MKLHDNQYGSEHAEMLSKGFRDSPQQRDLRESTVPRIKIEAGKMNQDWTTRTLIIFCFSGSRTDICLIDSYWTLQFDV